MATEIRLMTADDIPQVVRIISSHVSEDGEYASQYYTRCFQRDAAEASRECNYVALDANGAVVGVCGYGPDKYQTPGVLWLSWFYVAKSVQGTLVGYRLYERCLRDARELKTRKFCLDTCNYQAYAKAIRFYRSAGFRLEGTLENYYGPDDHMLIMGLELD